MRRGFSLLELILVLLLVGAGAGAVLPGYRRHLDSLAVRGAREAAAALFSRARSEAPIHGGASVYIEEPGVMRVSSGGELIDEIDTARLFRVRLVIRGTPTSAEIRYDGLGIGRVASRTLLFQRGAAEASLVISSYGRVSRP